MRPIGLSAVSGVKRLGSPKPYVTYERTADTLASALGYSSGMIMRRLETEVPPNRARTHGRKLKPVR
jgi:hypothetical protein